MSEFTIVEIVDRGEIVEFQRTLADPDDTSWAPHTLRIAIDGGKVKVKANEGAWTAGYGTQTTGNATFAAALEVAEARELQARQVREDVDRRRTSYLRGGGGDQAVLDDFMTEVARASARYTEAQEVVSQLRDLRNT